METELEAVNGRRVRAVEVFAHALRFFREHALKVNAVPSRPRLPYGGSRLVLLRQEVKDQSPTVLEGDEVRWVITVPAVWRQPAKQFMREAARLVGPGRFCFQRRKAAVFHSKGLVGSLFACFNWSARASCRP